MDFDWIYYNQAGMLLEKYEKFLELSIKDVSDAIKLNKFDFCRSDCPVREKSNVNGVCCKVLYFSYLARVIQA